MLFNFKDVESRFQSFIAKWFEFTKSHPDFCQMFFAYGYEKHGFVETRFLFQMHAVECLVREYSPNDPVIRAFEPLRKEWTESKALPGAPYTAKAFPSCVQLAMPSLFAAFIHRHWSLVSDIVGTTEDQFVESIFSTLEYVTERGKRNDAVLYGTNLYWLHARLTAVLKICVLKLLDFTDEEIRGLVLRNAEMNFVKEQVAPLGR